MIINNMNEQPTFQPAQQKSNRSRKWLKITAIVLISILAVSVIGYSIYAWQQNNRLQDDIAQQDEDIRKLSEENADLKKAQQSKDITSEEGSKDIIKLADWGVEFRLVESLLDTKVEYSAKTMNGETFYVLTTSRVQDLGGQCVKEPFGQIVTITRFSEKPIATPDGQLVNESAINGYYYVTSSPIAACSGVNEDDSLKGAPSEIETKDRQALRESVKSLKTAQ